MSRVTITQVLGVIGFVVIVGIETIIRKKFGQTEAFRFWGATLVATSVCFTFSRRIPVSVGNKELKALEGWRKAYVLVPAYGIGLAVAIFPHAVACAVNLRGYICA